MFSEITGDDVLRALVDTKELVFPERPRRR